MSPNDSATRVLLAVHSSTTPANATAAGPDQVPSNPRSCDESCEMSACKDLIVRVMWAAASSNAVASTWKVVMRPSSNVRQHGDAGLESCVDNSIEHRAVAKSRLRR